MSRDRRVSELRVFAALLAVFVGSSFAFAAEPGAKAAAKPKPARPKITISKETTYITGPLRPDGYPDYLAALNELMSRGVTPANNAAVPFWRAVGPKPIPAELRPQFFKMLGIEELPEKGAYIVPLLDFADSKTNRDDGDAEDAGDGELWQRLWDQEERAAAQPWSQADFPELFAWLAINEAPLRTIVEGTKRPRFYSPLVADQDKSLSGSLFLVDLGVIRDVGRLLRIRSTLRLKAGKIDDAWQDLLACHRLARHRAQGPFTIDQLVAISLEIMACKSDAALAYHGNPTIKQVAAWSGDFRMLSPIRSGAGIVDVGERYFGLDAVLLAAQTRTGPGCIDVFEDEAVSNVTNDAIRKLVADPRVDWNAVLREMNAGYDRLAYAYGRPTFKQRREALAAGEKVLTDQKRAMTQPGAVAKALDKDATPQSIGRHLGIILRASFTSAFGGCLAAETRQHMQVSLVQLAFALAGYRADHGKYPASLAELKPKYIAEIPKDLFTDKELIYRPQDGGKGYVLYSLGPNGRDDGGRHPNDEPEKYENVEFDKLPDDIAIRTPAAGKAKR